MVPNRTATPERVSMDGTLAVTTATRAMTEPAMRKRTTAGEIFGSIADTATSLAPSTNGTATGTAIPKRVSMDDTPAATTATTAITEPAVRKRTTAGEVFGSIADTATSLAPSTNGAATAAAATLTVAPGTIRTKPSSGVPPSTTIKSRDPEAPGKQFVVQATFNDTYESSLQDPTSTKYKETEAKYGRLLTKLYQDITGFLGITILGFEEGSLVVKFRVLLLSSSNATAFQIQETLVSANGTGKMNALQLLSVEVTEATERSPGSSSTGSSLEAWEIALIALGTVLCILILAFFIVRAFRAKRRSRDLETVKAAGLSASSKDNPATETSEQEMANMAA